MDGDHCPNCGDRLVDYRTDRQSAGTRDVLLSWIICVGCRHVGLKQWSFADTRVPLPQRTPSTRTMTRKSA
jgi:hypothetical protein